MPKSTKPTQTKRVGTNSNKLGFTQDRSGSRQEFRRGGVRAVGRIMADEQRLKDFITDAEVLVEYAKARYTEQRNEIKAKQKAQADLIEAQSISEATRAAAALESKRKEAARIAAELEVLEAASPKAEKSTEK